VTNNRSDFLALHGQEPLHAGVIIIISSVAPARQRERFSAALKHIGARDLTNTVVEVQYVETPILCAEYDFPKTGSMTAGRNAPSERQRFIPSVLPFRDSRPTLCLEGAQCKTLSAAFGVACEEARHMD
jgi:hypothetical protein